MSPAGGSNTKDTALTEKVNPKEELHPEFMYVQQLNSNNKQWIYKQGFLRLLIGL